MKYNIEQLFRAYSKRGIALTVRGATIESEPVLTDEEIDQALFDIAFDDLRIERNRLLAECDWTQTADAPVDKYAWAEYRQQLRDLPANTTDPFEPVWPTPPA